MQVHTVAEQLFFTTTLLRCTGDDRNWSGTGFIYGVETNAGTAHFLITNKHVLKNAQRIDFRFVRGEGGRPVPGSPVDVSLSADDELSWFGHPDASVDVAALPMGQVLNDAAESGNPAFFRAVGTELCLTNERAAELDAIEEVVFIGYPVGIHDSVNLLPIARKGMTASPVVADYLGMPAFLIDAAVYPGSSGSPVFVWNRGSYSPRGGGLVLGNRIMCLGVLAAVHTRVVEGRIEQVFETDPSWRSTHVEPVGLGIVFKAGAFDHCVDPVLAQHGLERVQQSDISVGEPGSDADAVLATDEPKTGEGGDGRAK